MTERPGELELALRESFAASPAALYRLMTDPGQLVRWWGPQGFSTSVSQFDPVVAGTFRLTMQPPDGEAFHLSGEFLEIDPAHRLSFTFRWDEPVPDDRETVVALSLARRDDGTELSLWQGTFATADRLELHADGWAESLERLGAAAGGA